MDGGARQASGAEGTTRRRGGDRCPWSASVCSDQTRHRTMSERSKKIVLPAYLIRRCEAFRIIKGDAQSYVLRDKLHGRNYDYEPWQFFLLEVLPGCETME